MSFKPCDKCKTEKCQCHPCYPDTSVGDCITKPTEYKATPLPDCIQEVQYCDEGCSQTIQAKCIILADGTTLQDWIDAAGSGGGGVDPEPGCKAQFPTVFNETGQICAGTTTNLMLNTIGGVGDGLVYYIFNKLPGQTAPQNVITVTPSVAPVTSLDISALAQGDYCLYYLAYDGPYTPVQAGANFQSMMDSVNAEDCAVLASGNVINFTVEDCSGGVDPSCAKSGQAKPPVSVSINSNAKF